MSKFAFVASFLASFVTMDDFIFKGETTRAVWNSLDVAAHAAQLQVQRWTHPIRAR